MANAKLRMRVQVVQKKAHVFERVVSDACQRACNAAPVVLGPDVIRIRFRLGRDWTEDPAVFFNVLLSDRVATDKKAGLLLATSRRAEELCRAVCDLSEYGWLAYFSYRSESEQVKLKDPEWE